MAVLDRVSITLKSILLATDFSPVSDKAAGYAKALALNYRSHVEIAHVFHSVALPAHVGGSVGITSGDRLQLSAQALGALQRRFAAAGLRVHTTMLENRNSYSALLRLSRKIDADLIVAGTHSKWILERMVLGSTAEGLIRNAGCPVLTVGPRAKDALEGPLVFRSIIYATDFSAQAAKAAVFALSFAQDSNAHVYFCHIRKHATTGCNEEFTALLNKMIPGSVYDWCTPQTVVMQSEPAVAILETAAKTNADLIVLGARNASFWLTHLEHGLTPSLLAEATCPVMTVC